jgi:cytoskeletal protein CcmA (bactofilin family)|tara:strand:+ start:963 stop:1280 length:318 start_codon:yes stop_codon:yes gene_type:complete
MADNSKTILREDLKIKGNVFEKENIQINAEIDGNVKAENLKLEEKGKINGNIYSSVSELEGTVSGDIKSSKVHISGTGDIEGTIKQKTLSIDEGAKLKIKTETSK